MVFLISGTATLETMKWKSIGKSFGMDLVILVLLCLNKVVVSFLEFGAGKGRFKSEGGLGGAPNN